jgi:copper resistance protein B
MQLKKLTIAAFLALALASAPALAQPDQDQGGFTPDFTDDDLFTSLKVEADYTGKNGGELRWDVEAWLGSDYQKLWLLSEGAHQDGTLEDGQVQLLYGRYLATFWDWRAGLRHDFEPDSLSYAVLGVKGLAPYRFDTDASLYLSEDGDISLGLETKLDLLITQRLIAQPYLELEVFAQDVPELGKGAGLSALSAGLRARYEIRREIAPYADVGYRRLFGDTADFAETAGEDKDEFVVRAGLRLWY